MESQDKIEARREKYRRHNAKRATDPAYVAARRARDRARYARIKHDPAYRERRRQKYIRETGNPDLAMRNWARRMLASAIRVGLIERKPCEVCGADAAEVHHDDYTRPLEVRWLCKPHHDDMHRRAI